MPNRFRSRYHNHQFKPPPPDLPLTKTNSTVKSISNHELRVKGKIKGLKISIQGKERTINAIVTENLPGIIIIGADSIMRYPDLLTHIVESETGKPTPHKKKKHYLQRNRKKLRRDDNKQISRYIQNRTIRYESMHNNKS